MMPSPTPVFGKRNRPKPPVPIPGLGRRMPPPPDAVFAAASRDEDARRVVPRSFGAALLAGLVVGCGLVGLDVTRERHALDALAPLIDQGLPKQALLPSLILLGVLGGGRAAATNLLLSHVALARAGRTSHAAYTLGGMAAAALVAGALAVLSGMPPTHGWAIDLAAGGAAGFIYRVFAGSRPA